MILLDPQARPIIAHRGASGDYPENTFAAFDAAVRQGADAIELDVRASRDGIPVVIHDETVDRVTGESGTVASLDRNALACLDPGDGEGIPALDDVLDRYAETPLLVELKAAECAEPVATLLRARGATGRVVVGSFVHAALRPFRRSPYWCSGSRRDVMLAWGLSRMGLPAAGRCHTFSVPPESRGLHVADGRFAKACSRAGKPLHVWTIDSVDEARRLRRLGVSGIITNFPERMRVLEH